MFDNLSLSSGPIPTSTQIFSLQDKTSHGNDLTNSGGTDTTTNLPFADSSHAVDFEASESDKLIAADSASLSVTGSLTIETWVKFNSLPTGGSLMELASKYYGSSDNRSYGFGLAHTGPGTYALRFRYSSDGTYQGSNDVSTAWTPSTGIWYHVAVVLDTSVPNVKFYVDGTQQGSTINSNTGTSISDSTNAFYLGSQAGNTFFLDGELDEVRIWNIARTQTQINDNKSRELTGSETGLAAYYPMEVL